jgi:hypothetical protein
LININKNQESTSLSRISKLLLKVCTQLFKNSKISHTIDTKTERWHWNKKQKEAFHMLKKSFSKTAHFVISQSTCERYVSSLWFVRIRTLSWNLTWLVHLVSQSLWRNKSAHIFFPQN